MATYREHLGAFPEDEGFDSVRLAESIRDTDWEVLEERVSAREKLEAIFACLLPTLPRPVMKT